MIEAICYCTISSIFELKKFRYILMRITVIKVTCGNFECLKKLKMQNSANLIY